MKYSFNRKSIQKDIEKFCHCVHAVAVFIAKILWPEVCPFCGKAAREGVCANCSTRIEELRIHGSRCFCCSKPVRYKEQEYCSDCRRERHLFKQGRAVFLHKPPINHALYQYKYHNQRFFCEYCVKEIVENNGEWIKRVDPQVIIPVPLHPKRKRLRGYNQAELLARGIGGALHIPVRCDLVKRRKYTDPQKMFKPRERKQNLNQAFAPGSWDRRYARVLIVDDIYTTGNTLDAVSLVLRQMNVLEIYFITVSIGQGY